MSTKNLRTWVLAGCVGLFAALLGTPEALAAATAPGTEKVAAAAAAKLDNATCQTCHDGSKHQLKTAGADGEERDLLVIDKDKFGKSVHATMQCTACHTDITDNKAPHSKAGAAKKADCIGCHEALWEDAKKNHLTKEKPRLGAVVENIEAYKKSFHARLNKEDKTRVYATCNECHEVHSFAVPPAGTKARDEWRLTTANACGEQCHTDQLEEYAESVHGVAVIKDQNLKSAVCIDCHTTHAIGNTSAAPIKLAITASCGNCHEDAYQSYKATYHGQIGTLGYVNTAKCADCHGSHGITKIDDPASMVGLDNRLKTCKQCHNPKKGLAEAPDGFISYAPHAKTDDFGKYPQIWAANKLMIGLLLSTFGFFWLHTALWFYRELMDRRARKPSAHVKVADALPAGQQNKQFRRFSLTWRIAHLSFALSLMVLSLTGLPLFYPDTAWAPWVMQALGGPQVASIVHRVSALVFVGVFFWHIAYIALRIGRNWSSFKFFGPESLIPNWQDMHDMIAMFKWFFGKGPRPVFDRWTYWEKFDYWAPFWGVTIIGVSGVMMWLPHVTAAYLPGWVFNVAAIFHAEEAFLAIVFLFTVHFFNNHFRPDKFPLDVVMFTGSMPLEEFKHAHKREYQRLVETGELDQYLVDAPSRPMALGAKILGFTLIAAGLALLTLVAIGFFGGA